MTCTDDHADRTDPGGFDPSALDDEQLTEAVCCWGAQVAASTCRFVLLAAELDRRERAWAGVGVTSCAHWLNWRCGLSLGAAREHLRVGHALDVLSREVGDLDRGLASEGRVAPVMVVEVEPTVKGPGALVV